MALPVYLQSAVDTATNAVVWTGLACIVVIVAKFALTRWVNGKVRQRRALEKMEADDWLEKGKNSKNKSS